MNKSSVFLLFATAAVLAGATTFTFETPDYSGSTAGVALNGQQGWYIPPMSGGGTSVHSYVGNAPGFVSNPSGGDQFAGGVGRLEHAFDFSVAPLWEIAWDMAIIKHPAFDSALAARFSLIDAGGPLGFVVTAVATLTDPTDPNTTWTLGYTGQGVPDPGIIPGSAWQGLEQNHWYRTGVTIDYANGGAVRAWILDPSNGNYDEVTGFLPFTAGLTPDAIRLFGNGGIAAWDNITLQGVPEPATFPLLGCGLVILGALSRRRF